MNSNEPADSDENDSPILISPRRRSVATTTQKSPEQKQLSHYEELTNSLYSFTYSQTTGLLLNTRLSAMQRSAVATDSGSAANPSPTLHSIFQLLQFLQGSLPLTSAALPAAAKRVRDELDDAKPGAIDEATLRFLTLPYIDIVKPGEREPSLSLQRPPSMFRRASSMIITSSDSVIQGICTPLEHLPSKYMHTQAVLTTDSTFPYGIRTLNDIACLVCVTSQQTAPGRNIFEFVAPQFRDWLSSRINENPEARVRLSGELVDLLIMNEPKMVSLWVEQVGADRLVWTLQEVRARTAPISDVRNEVGPSSDTSSKIVLEPTMRHNINEQNEIVLSSPLGFREPSAVGCAVAVDRSSLVICGYNKPTLYFMLGYKGEDLQGKPVNNLLPQFPQFWSQVEPLCSKVGVVIPEHKFRELAGVDINSPEFISPHPSCDPVNSIRATSKSGAFTFVDIQLRLVDSRTLVIWISYSRACEGITSAGATLNVPSQRTLMPSVMSQLEHTPSSSSAASFTEEVAAHNVITEDNSHSEQQAVRDEYLRTPASVESMANYSEDRGFEASKKDKISNRESEQDKFKPSPLESVSRPETLNGDSTGTSDDEVWAELSKVEVGAHRRSKSVEDFEIIKVLGEGAYGRVSLARPKGGKYVIAFKSIFKDRILIDTWSRDRKLGTIPNEIRILNQLRPTRHPHIVEMVDFFEDTSCFHLEMLPIGNPQGVDLFDFLEGEAANMSQGDLLKVWGQVVSAVAHIHSLGIVHRDLKDENIVMDGKGNAKLIDFGSAAYLKQGPFDVFVGTVDYAAPEIVQGQTYEGCPQDSWALGILLYTIMYKETPFHGIEAIIEGNLPADLKCLGSSLIRRLLVKNPASRPTPARCLEYLKDMETK